jgi:hypothetical protein
MADTQPDGDKNIPPRRKRRLILKIAGTVVAVVLLLVLAVPTLLSTGPAVSIILGQVNKQLNGKIQVASLSLGWFTNVKLDGVRVIDSTGAQIAELDHATIQYPLRKAITGNLSFGDIVIQGLSFDAKSDSNGQLNFAKLTKPGSTEPASAPKTSGETKPSKLPSFSGNLKLTDCRGTFAQPNQPTVFLTKLDGDIKIPDINQPITDQITAGIRVGDQPEGSISITGSAGVITANQVAINTATVHQKIEVNNLDLQTAKAFIPVGAGVSTLEGLLGMQIDFDLTDGKNAQIDVSITAAKPIAIGGKILQGDTYTTKTFTTEIPRLSVNFPDGIDHWQSGRIKVESISVKVDQGNVTLLADLTPQAILNILAGTKPGATGQLAVTSNFDLAKIIPQLRHTVPVAEGVLIQTAGLSENIKLAWTPEKAQLSNSADSTTVQGTQKLADGSYKAISIGAIHLSTTATDLGGNGKLPELRDLQMVIKSPFANGNFSGSSLSDLHGTLNANLQAVGNQLGQFFNLQKLQLGGNLQVDLSGTGQLTAAPYQSTVKLTAVLHNLKYGTATGQQVNEPLLQLILSADLQGSERNTLESAKNVLLTLMMGDANAPTVDVLARMPGINLLGDLAGEFELSHLHVDLAKLQSELAGVPAGQAGVVVNQGDLSISSAGNFAGPKVTLDSLAINADKLFVSRQLPGGKQISALAGEAVTINIAGAAEFSATGTSVHLNTLNLSDVGKIIDLHKDGNSDFAMSLNSAGAISGQGKLSLAAQLGSLNSIAKVLGQNELTVKTTAGEIKSGTVAGTLELQPGAANKTGINANFKLNDIVITSVSGTLPAQSATLDLKATDDQVASTLVVENAGIQSNLATINITNANLSLAAKSIPDEVQSAHWQVAVADIKPVMELVDAYSSPQVAVSKGGTKPLPPVHYTSGAILLAGDLSHDQSTMKINVSDVSAKNVAFERGTIKYAARPVDVKLAVVIQTTAGKTVMDQIQQVQITQLTGDLGIATLSMQSPIVITQLSTNPAANGSIQLAGNLTVLTQLMAAMQGETPDAYPYGGQFDLTENISTEQNTVNLKGGLQIANFQSFNGKTVTFSEPHVVIGNDVALTTLGDDESVLINSLTAAMQSSGAMNISLANGSIHHLQSSRDMRLQLNVNYDLAKLWPIVQPMMGDKYKTLKIAGQYQKQFNVTGSYPADQPSTVAIKTLHADGDLAVSSFDYDGLNMQNFILPFTLDQGQLVTVYVNKPAGQNMAAPATANGGTLDLGDITLDLTQDPMRLTIPQNKLLISNMTVNPLFADSFMAKFFNNPLFTGNNTKTGQLSMTMVDCIALPLGDLVTKQTAQNNGKADMKFSLLDLNVGFSGIEGLSNFMKMNLFKCDVKDATVSVARGISTQHISFASDHLSLDFDGKVRLADEAMIPLNLSIGPLTAVLGNLDPNILKFLPDRLVLPLEGSVNKAVYPRPDKAIAKMVQDAALKAGVNGIFGGNKNNGGGNSNPLGGLLKGLGK